MGQVLYRKHRPKKLSEVVGQEHVTETLAQALKQDRLSHAYLFTGPRGVGKTSIARILAHEINKLPYDDDTPHIDIIEIDAASNRRIDEIRELRDKVYVAPTSAKYKVYIIDEVHMLTREAFNALLKTLEEPPEHVVFILATTDAHKLPETIVSRTQRFSFKPVEKSKVVKHLQDIAKKEGLKVEPEAMDLLAEHGEGSFRDSISLLDQASSQGGKVEAGKVRQLLGLPPTEALEKLLGTLQAGDSAVLMKQLLDLQSQGYQAVGVAKQLSGLIRNQLTMDEASDRDISLGLLKNLLGVPAAYDPQHYLEICLLEALPQTARQQSPKAVPQQTAVQDKPSVDIVIAPKKEEIKPSQKTKSTGSLELREEIWPEVLAALKSKHNTLYGIIRMAEPDFTEEGKLKLSFAFAFHQKRSNENNNRQKLANIVQELSGKTVVIECLLDPKAKPVQTPLVAAPAESNQDLSTISNIFGEAELLES
jgi:DNA polymerase-3 subunit gamma/tau